MALEGLTIHLVKSSKNRELDFRRPFPKISTPLLNSSNTPYHTIVPWSSFFPFLRVYVFIPRYLHLDTRVSSAQEFEAQRGTQKSYRRGAQKRSDSDSEGRQAFHWQVTGVQGKKQLSCINSLTESLGENEVGRGGGGGGYRGPAKTKRIDHHRRPVLTLLLHSPLPSSPSSYEPRRLMIRQGRSV